VDLIPAIDLLDGIAVRLVQGDYGRPAASLSDPVPLVRDWIRNGVRWLHLVDLGGARAGHPIHLELARSLASSAREAEADVRVELGGGLRRPSDVERAFDAGMDVAILGTAAIENRALLTECASRWPGRIAVSIDVRGDAVALDGWTRGHPLDPLALATELAEAGAAHVIVTDVERDGTRRGPNRELLSRMRDALRGVRLVAAGGIGRVEDLRALESLGIDGAVVGLALLDGSLSIADALLASIAGAA
jgi:phosphoribosylformimino-5-aminoimidazole carboxamide ribotide isomerase